MSFRGSELLFEYFPGRGLQLHPLATFKRKPHARRVRAPPSRTATQGLERLLDEMIAFAVRRDRRFVAGNISSTSAAAPAVDERDGTGNRHPGLARAARLLDEPRYLEVARRALGAFRTPPPRGVRTTGPTGGVHYLQYSFAPRLFIFNAFLQSLIGLHDFARLAPDEGALATTQPSRRRHARCR